MNPKKLTMTAFGPYKDTEIIDFNELEGQSLFVISGNTGAGKTTIFDGICFALYGTASGQDRENNLMLRSDFANDDVHTAVELEFELNGRYYRILRQLGHKKKGNKTKTGDRFEFYEQIDGEEVPCVDKQIVSEINDKVEQLLGLTQDQFKQIVMLPQGEFRKLLTSETENKEAILRRLFKTESYKKIGELLLARQGKLNDLYKQESHQLDTYVKQISSFPKREETLLFEVLQQEHYNTGQLIDGVKAEIDHYHEQMKKDHQAYKKVYEQHEKEQEAYFAAKNLNDQFQELEKKELSLQDLQKQAPQYEEKEIKLKAAERASNIEPYERVAINAKQDEEKKQHELVEVEKHKQAVEHLLATAQKDFTEQEGKKEERENVRQQLDRLEQYLPTVKEIDQQKQSLAKSAKLVNEMASKLKCINEQWKKERALIETNEKTLIGMDKQLSNQHDKQTLLLEMRETSRLIKSYEDYSKKQVTIEKDRLDQENTYNKARTYYTKLENKWLNQHASVLASHLHDGAACPVCGSLEHPEKATSNEDDVTKEMLEETKEQLDKLEKSYQQALVVERANIDRVKEATEQLEAEGILIETIVDFKKEHIEKGLKLKKEVEQLQEVRNKQEQLRQQTEQLRTAVKQSETEKDRIQREHDEQRSKYEQAKAIYQDRLNKIPEEMHVLSELEKQISGTQTKQKQLEKAWEDAQKKLNEAQQEQMKALTTVEQVRNQLNEASERKAKAHKELNEAIVKGEFASIETYKQAKQREETREKWKSEIEQFKQQISTLQEQVTQLQNNLKDKTKVDLEALQKQLEALKALYESKFEQSNASKRYYEDLSNLLNQIIETNERLQEREKQLALVTDLSNMIRGQNEHRISFERFLQMEYLDQIIDAANLRLQKLSNGQFHLIRSERQESHGRQSGLALDVFDSYTGQTRDVKTLSGGEKFNASLCLALGMSDVIQSFQGNVSIQTMFIDEGFGSLDEESLHKSIDTLIDLQKSGRMIGVISHVKELKSIFPAVLEVTKTKEGYSETEFLIK